MRIGILTFHRSYNYGAFMQCFSLVKRLEKEFPGHSIEVIDYSSGRAMDGYEKALEKYNASNRKKVELRNRCFIRCQEDLPLSKRKIVSDQMDEIVQYMNENYDMVIVGSDAVWNWNVRGFPNAWFLKDYNGIKMSYAASVHGMTYQYMSKEQKEYVSDALKEFSYIGVRDRTTEEFVRFVNPELECHHNCDPTMFLDLKEVPCDREKLKKKISEYGIDFSKPIIGIMSSDVKYSRNIKKKYAEKAHIVAIYEPNIYADAYIYDLEPYEWANIFSFFDVTVTHFFHGTMLSLVNNTPVIPIEFLNDFSSKNITKIKDLMTRLDLLSWRKEADYRNSSLFARALRKYGICIDKKLWKPVFDDIDDMMKNDYSELIKERKEKEKLTADSFIEALRQILN